MSLINLALRIATVAALKGATWAGDRVFDSQIDALDERITKERAPAIVVYIDEDKSEPSGKDVLNAERDVSLIIEITVASRVEVELEGGGTTETLVIPHTDPGIEASIDLIRRQAFRALLDGSSVWSQIWGVLVSGISTVNTARGANSEPGVKWAARQIVVKVKTISDPPFGAAPDGVWADLIAAMEAVPDKADLAKLIEAEMTGAPLEGWAQAAAALGLSGPAATAVALGAIDGGTLIEATVLAGEDTDTDQVFKVDEDGATVTKGPSTITIPEAG